MKCSVLYIKGTRGREDKPIHSCDPDVSKEDCKNIFAAVKQKTINEHLNSGLPMPKFVETFAEAAEVK